MLDLRSLAKDLAAVAQPVEKAHGLPSVLYTDPDALRLEWDRIFHRGWSCIGFAHDVANPGDVAPIDHLGAPLIMARDKTGTLRVFENVCRHRGMILVEEKKNIGGVLRCPYHSWCYSLDGKLRATPHVGGPGLNVHESIDPAKTGLTEVRSAVFMGVVFVNLSGDAVDFAEWAGPVARRMADFVDRPLFHGGPESSFKLDLKANWKLIMENNCESYHLPWVHPGLNAYSRLEDHYHLDGAEGFSGQGTLVYNPKLDPDLAFPDFEGLPERWSTSAEYPTFYPNTFFAVHRDHFWAAHLDPKAVDRTIERIEIFYTTEEAATSDKYRALREKNAAQWKSVLTEDIMVTEGMQKGRGAPNFDGGVFSPVMDSPTHTFHDWIAGRLS
jgi:phenylpropionate dioxygenase-like ring-hydroxylating dioxygenase large terminal subunit